MVTGIERWKEYFSEYKDKYVLIGGAACNLLEEELDMNPRATKDLDLILVVEALTPDFGLRLWDFIKSWIRSRIFPCKKTCSTAAPLF